MAERKRVAAVCYRRNADEGLEFLLVRTRQNTRWTFPKGGLESFDCVPSEGARREALEEAGIDGVVDSSPLLTYRHRAHLGGDDFLDQVVEAYLLRVTGQIGQAEPGRQPTWFTRAAAAAALAENQSADADAAELRTVLDAAHDRLLTGPSGP